MGPERCPAPVARMLPEILFFSFPAFFLLTTEQMQNILHGPPAPQLVLHFATEEIPLDIIRQLL